MNSFLKNKKSLVILEMANNHMGDFRHAKKIIREYSQITRQFKKNIDFAIKFQFRDLNTFLHKDFLKKKINTSHVFLKQN